jgi:hypothetical protein
VAFELVGSPSEGNTNGGSDISLTMPTVQADDVAIIAVTLAGGSNSTRPSKPEANHGFTFMGRSDNTTAVSCVLYRKTLDGSEDGSAIAIDSPSTQPITAHLFVCRGLKISGATWPSLTPPTTSATNIEANTDNGTSAASTAFTSSQADCVNLMFVSGREAANVTITATPDASMLEIEDTPRATTTSYHLSSAYEVFASTTIPVQTATISHDLDTAAVISLALELPVSQLQAPRTAALINTGVI